MGTRTRRSRVSTRVRVKAVVVFTAVAVAVSTLPAAMLPLANANHDASDFFNFAKAEADGGTSKANEPTCDGSNDKQTDFSGSGNDVLGRIHSNADTAIS